VAATAVAVLAGTGVAASAQRPEPTSPPVITGTPNEGGTLLGHVGTWKNGVREFHLFWRRCNRQGGGCVNVDRQRRFYRVTAADVGHRMRFAVEAVNNDGRTAAVSDATDVVGPPTGSNPPPSPSPPPPPPPPGSTGRGCPSGGGTANVSEISAPARLILDGQQSNPSVVTRGTGELVLRYHVSDTCGHNVQGALVYSTAVPFNQWSIPGEVQTGSDGWAEVRMHPLRGFPVSSNQQLIALFARARKSGESLLGGISTRRLFSVRVNLHG